MNPSKQTGFSLIETLVAVFIFSISVYMASLFIQISVARPFSLVPPEKWTAVMDLSRQRFLALPNGHSLLQPGKYETPFSLEEILNHTPSYQLNTWPPDDTSWICGEFSTNLNDQKQLKWEVCRE